ncbi:MAG: hypothetical protein KDD11_09090 [Acidobacteria bacterium]|nr:hypothetical protein [Acidobacteriota bacterium]
MAASDDETMKVSAILDALDSSGKLEQIGAQASRYLQHGLRIPTSFPATPTTPTKALYLMDGQQFPIRLTDDTAWTVEMSVNPAASFIGVDTTVPPKMTISADKDDLGRQTVIALQTAKVDTGSSSAEPLATLAAKPLEFALQNKTVWQPAGAPEAGIFAYGADLQNRLETDGALQMVLRNAPGMGPVDALGLGVVDDPHYWSLRIDLRVQKIVSSTQNPTPLPNTYQIGGAAEAERDLLKRWLDAVLAGDALGVAGIDILYKNPDSSVTGMVSGQIDPSRILLMKTNLSTESAPAGSAAAAFLADAAVPSDEFSATLDDPAKFLRLIWEVSIVNAGGYFLFYQDTQGKGLPDQIFDGGTLSASVTFLVRYANRAQALAATNFRTGGVREVTADTVGPYTNVLVLEPTAGESESGDVLYAEAPEIPAYHAAFATDSLGFQVTRPNPETSLDLGGELARMAGTSEGLTRDQVRAVLLEAGLAADSDELIEVMKAAGDDQAALANLFNLMTYWIEDAGGFRASIRGLPVGPTEEAGQGIDEEPAAGDPWTYRQAIPVAPYAVPESQADTVSPYAAVGKTVTVGFEYLDLFGNPAISNQTIPPLTTELRYFDPIIALDNWSGVTAEYQVTPKQGSAGTGTVGAQLSFDGNVFLGDTEGVASQDEKVANALETYRTLVDQLGGPGVSAYTTTSVAPGVKSPSALATLQKFAGQIVAFLESLPGGGGPGPIIDADPITFEVTLADRNKITANIFEVSAALHIERDPNLVDEEAKKDLPAAQAVATALTARTLPEQGDVSSDSNTQSLTGFAKLFEKAFPELVAATGQGASGPRTLFAIRMGAADGSQGITFDLAPSGSAPLYYAPPPLFNNLLARNIDVTFPAPAGGQPIPFRRNVAGVDMDVLGAGFLSATDLFLSAANAVPARQANPAGYFKVIDSKEPLADAISSSVLPVLADQQQTGAQLAAAKEAFRQRLLVVLGDAYNIATIVQHPASATNSDAGSGKTPPNLFGKVLGAVPKAARTLGGDLEENGFALTPTKVALPDGSTLLTTLLTTLKIEDQKSLTLDLGYRVTHVEYDIEPGFSNDPEGYQSSSWLTLILPQEVRPVGKGAATIPIPLRQYPLPPSLAAQSATPKVQVAEVCPNQARFTAAFGAPDGEISLETVEEWSYSYKYQETSPADQDTVITNILFNVGRDVPSARAFAAPSPDLLDWLVYFSEQYPKLEVPQTLAAFAADPGNEAARKAASVAVDQMAYLVSNIAQVWPAWVEGRVVGRSAALLRAPMDTFEYSYLVEEKRAQNEIELNLLGQTPEVFPNIEVPTASGGTQLLKPNHQAGTRFATYTYSNPPQTPDLVRTLIFDDLNVLNVENGWGGIQLSRNRVLIEGQTTTPVFVYNTPLVRFVNKKTPLINSVAAIDLAKNLKPAEKTLKGYLTALFDALLGGADPKLIAGAVTGAGQRLVKVGASYAYDGRGGKGGAQGPCDPTALNVYLPILQRTPFLYDTTNGQAFIDNLAAVIEQWQSELENPSTARAFYSFDISLFAALSDIQLPVLRINNLWLGLDQITS